MPTDEEEPPMGEGRSPDKEIVGWEDKNRGGSVIASDVGLNIPRAKWKKRPKDSLTDKPLVLVGKTNKKKIPIFLSEADNRPDQTGGALYLFQEHEEEPEEK